VHAVVLIFSGIIAMVKRSYRRNLIQAVLDEASTITEVLRSLTIKDAVYMVADAWKAVSQEAITNTWNKALGNPFEQPEPEEEEEEEFLGFSEQEVREACSRADAKAAELSTMLTTWTSCDDQEAVSAPFSLDDFLDEPDQEPEPEPEPIPATPLNVHKVLEASELMREWYDHVGETHRVIQMTATIRDLKKRINTSKRQTSIKDFFAAQ